MGPQSEPGMGIIHSEFAGSTILVFLFILRSSSSSITSNYAFSLNETKMTYFAFSSMFLHRGKTWTDQSNIFLVCIGSTPLDLAV